MKLKKGKFSLRRQLNFVSWKMQEKKKLKLSQNNYVLIFIKYLFIN